MIRKNQEKNVGLRFGRLLITGFSRNNDNSFDSYYTAVCDCGSIINFPYRQLYHKKSCSCLKRAIKYDDEVYCFTSIYNRWIQHNNLSRKKHIDISLETFMKLSKQNCYYCNQPPSNKTRIAGIKISGIDRINNNIGYTEDNVKSCCAECNLMKQKFTKEFFINQIEKIFNYQQEKRENVK